MDCLRSSRLLMVDRTDRLVEGLEPYGVITIILGLVFSGSRLADVEPLNALLTVQGDDPVNQAASVTTPPPEENPGARIRRQSN